MVILVVLLAFLINGDRSIFDVEPWVLFATLGAFVAAMYAYIVLHELIHGAVYKMFTGEKLTYGITLSCAYCGVPNIYVYRRPTVFALAAPLVLFMFVFVPLTVAMYFVLPLGFIASAFLLGFHIGGCSGDIYMLLLFLFKFRDNKTLVKDMGPEQYIYTVNPSIEASSDMSETVNADSD